MATSADHASSTRAVASQRSTRRVSPGPAGARSLQKNRFLSSGNDNGGNRYIGRMPRIVVIMKEKSKRNLASGVLAGLVCSRREESASCSRQQIADSSLRSE